METTLGPWFINDTLAQLWWLDSWYGVSLPGKVRITYPTSYTGGFYPLRIYSNEDRSNLTDIGWPQDSFGTGSLVQAAWNDLDLLHLFNVSCVVKPVNVPQTYGTYQRAICLGTHWDCYVV